MVVTHHHNPNEIWGSDKIILAHCLPIIEGEGH